MNKSDELLYKKNFSERKSYCNKISKKDRKFYRKRILNLTRELFLSTDACTPDVVDAFMNYIYHCVEHFKNTDTNDILQFEYMNGDADGDADCDGEGEADADCDDGGDGDYTFYNSSILRKIVKPNTLDNFIIRNVIKKNETEHLPLQKEINLKDPQLRVKGICKKKNLMNTYEETDQTHSETETFEELSEDREKKEESSVTPDIVSSL